jgi:ribosome-associated protein
MSNVDSRCTAPHGVPAEIERAARAAYDKKAFDLVVLDLRSVAGFTDFFVICSGQNPRQVKAIADAIEETLGKARLKPAHIEGYERAEWVLLDYFNFVVHVFNLETRRFYALERLWGSAGRVEIPDVPSGPQVEDQSARR